ncbi:LysR family transcriptional regulator [Methylotenera mobilis]|uniref:Transcriptional regulator, LysR family n=1 Tax=Methylotenera mobilis (strain JLW8 / ATCC BAA-1282 / DSM 17540) TaxID=583345 RepID=C6WY23_METML|nr:LysR family transcriptional regulator [Methylotenera mobilis]ACT46919.1 transcriptional regulator, LysR family [Methylotenera mobilis JLW8]
MRDINDYILFAEVVNGGSFAAASRRVRIPKSTISRRIGLLEERLGARLIERSTRRFRVTEIGQSFYERCKVIMLDVEQADSIVSESLSEPKGLVRCSCPLGLYETLSPIFSSFLLNFPHARLQLVAGDNPVNLIEDRIDVAIRIRTVLDTDGSLVMRTLGHSERVLVASPNLANGIDQSRLDNLSELPTISTSDQNSTIEWQFHHASLGTKSIRHEPKLSCIDFATVREAAIAGIGIALLPDHTCSHDLQNGRLVRVFPEWKTTMGILHIVFTTRRGLPPVVRAFIDHLATQVKGSNVSRYPMF